MHVQCQYVPTNGLRLHIAAAGPADGPLMILLHGFPEFWYGWRNQIEPLADAGFCVWAPDQRGYNLSDKPPGVKAYALDRLAADVTGLIDAAGRRQAVLVGHDWGGAVAWHVAAQAPDRVARAVILNVPHPAVMMQQLRRNPRQLAQLVHVRVSASLAARTLADLSSRLAARSHFAPHEPPGRLFGCRPGTLPRGLAAAARHDRHAQLVPRGAASPPLADGGPANSAAHAFDLGSCRTGFWVANWRRPVSRVVNKANWSFSNKRPTGCSMKSRPASMR